MPLAAAGERGTMAIASQSPPTRAMPHLILEIASDVPPFDGHSLLRDLHLRLVETGHFEAIEIKGRIHRPDVHRVGLDEPGETFAHAELRLMPGRPPSVLAALPAQLVEVLDRGLPAVPGKRLQVTAEVIELRPEHYAKTWRANAGSIAEAME